MELTCPECGSDAAVTRSDAGGGRLSLTCHFSHGGKGSVTWTVQNPGVKQSAVRAPRAPRAPRTPKVVDTATATNQRATDAFCAEVVRRGGQATLRRSGQRKEVVVKPAGVAMEFVVLIRSRTAGDFQTSTEYGKTRVPEQFPTRFWAFVDLFPGQTNFYIVPEWWIQNDIKEKHELYLAKHEGERPVNADSTHHGIDTSRVAEWAGKWRQLGL